jgi:hypothetical protein
MTTGNEAVADRLSAAVPTAPEDRAVFRLAQLLLLLETVSAQRAKVDTIDRLGYYDFFAANPFIVLDGSTVQDERDRVSLLLAGFNPSQLSYASTGQRFASRRRRIQHDLSLLLSHGLLTITATGYELTSAGQAAATELTSMYADAYRRAAAIVVRRLKAVGDRPLRQRAERWLGQSWLLVDLFSDVTEQASTTTNGREGFRG